MDLECYRDYLRFLAELQIGSRWNAKLDLSGVIQQTLMEAHEAQKELEEKPEPVQRAWLRRALANNLTDEMRKLQAAIHNVLREGSLEDQLTHSSVRIEGILAARGSSPSHKLMRDEQILALNEALDGLPDDQRQALVMHHLQGESLADVAETMQRSPGAVASLVFRGLRRLRRTLEESEVNQQ